MRNEKKGARESKVGSGDKGETDKKCNYAVFKNQANCNCVTDLARGVDQMLIKRLFKNDIARQQVQFFEKNTGMILAWIVVYV